ncbi:AbrB/MazE/SpoVT family DNA-binding domain-containing protein [Anaerolinea thermophila]|uniref:SpoVT-AbrB domain-containing protein n=1 Tax=Anaerolinea thermophila (strain DSM 14523 / JCM 11388 / NBRC 100420 / UNI-1) TaxID=926569 RepID=E8MXV6_ANATU|nr:AbrB/MazE/SpoVT family DNA-binding domain-containing protein [Anaerolinea thermophila]BAJ64187.1 hypothetical protein ANT_21610 [Anaerolinea thermophila UNI-1]
MTANEVVQVSSNGRITLPSSIRYKVGLSEGDLLRIEVSEEGQIILTPVVALDRTQAYFWTPRWQAGEQEAEADILSGRVRTFSTVDDLFEDLTGE